MCISQFKEMANIIQAYITSGAIIFGIIWSYVLFIKNRQKYPRANIVHQVTHKHIENDKLLLHVGVTISNVGNVLISLDSMETRIQQVFPFTDEVLEAINKGQNPLSKGKTEVAWPLIDSQKLDLKSVEGEVEPGESQDFHQYFTFDAEIETIEVYTDLINEAKRARKISWCLTTLYKINEIEEVSSHKRKGKNNA